MKGIDIMIRITLNIENFEKMKDGTFNQTISSLKTVSPAPSLASTLLDLAALADNKIGKTARLIKEIVRIFSI